MIFESGELMQKNARPLVERATRFRQRNSIAATVEQRQAQLGFKILDRRDDGCARLIFSAAA